MVKMKRKQIKTLRKEDAITSDEEYEGEEDVIIIDAEDEGWQTSLDEEEEEDIDIMTVEDKEEGWEFRL